MTPWKTAAPGDPGPAFVPANIITIGSVEFAPGAPPGHFHVAPDLGLLLHDRMHAQRVHANAPPDDWVGEARAVRTPGGDYLVMFAGGRAHYHGKQEKFNDMVAYRSADRGRTWTGPTIPWRVPYNQHGFIPFVPRRSNTLYAFGTEPRFDVFDGDENAPIGFRTSADDGHTWSAVTLVHPSNDPDFRGMAVMRMAESGMGTWFVGSHTADWTRRPITTRQYLLRSEDRGASWTVLPGTRPGGWFAPGFDRMDEGRPLSLGGPRLLFMTRTPEGHLWALRSADDGQTWSRPQPTPLVHPDAPPMLFHLADGKTLIAFHHNRHTGGHFHPLDRTELWASRSTDDGLTWDEPRFVLANAAQSGGRWSETLNHSVSYVDLLVDGNTLHLFLSHQFRQLLHVQFGEQDLDSLPTRDDLVRQRR